MLIVDVIAVVVLIGAFAGGLARGFFASLGTVVGTVLGAVAALWLLPLVTPWVATVVPEGVWRGGADAGREGFNKCRPQPPEVMVF